MARHNSLKALKNHKVAESRSRVWFKQAQFDLSAAELSLANEYPEWAVYQAEQAVEKAIKSVIVHAGYQPPRIHKLPVLIGIANQLDSKFKSSQLKFKGVESFTFISRYPFLLPGREEPPHNLIRRADAEESVMQSKELLRQMAEIISAPFEDINRSIPASTINYSEAQVSDRIERIKDQLISRFEPAKIVLFGSFARDYKQPQGTTMDLLIVADTNLSFVERIVAAREVTKGGDPVVEPLVYTPEELNYMINEEGEGFFELALEEGKIIFEK